MDRTYIICGAGDTPFAQFPFPGKNRVWTEIRIDGVGVGGFGAIWLVGGGWVGAG